MPVNTASDPSFGRVLGETNRLIGKLHRRALSEYSSDFPTWMLLTLLEETEGPTPLDNLIAELDRRADLSESDVLQLLERAAAAGHVDYSDADPAVAELNREGAAHFAAVYAHSLKTTDGAFEGSNPGELESARLVLLAAKERAATLLAAAETR